jgi:hypothetical protein
MALTLIFTIPIMMSCSFLLSVPMPYSPDSVRRQSALALASTFSNVLTIIRTSYREPLHTFLKELWLSSKKMANARVSLETLQQHKATGSWPPALCGLKPPAIALTSELTREAMDAKLILGSLQGCINDYKAEALDCLIATKKAEVEWFVSEKRSRDRWLPRLEEIVRNIYDRTRKSTEYPMIPMSSASTDVLQGRMGMLVPDWVQTVYRNWKIDLPHVAERVLSLAQHQRIAHLEKREAKTSLKAQADVVMTNVSASRSMQETISDEVPKAVTTALKQKGGSAPPKSELAIDNPCFISKLLLVNRKRQLKTEESIGVEGRVQGDSTQETSFGKNARRKIRVGGEKEELRQRNQNVEALKKTRLADIFKSKFNVNVPTSLPDSILEIPFSDAVQQIILKTEIGVLENTRDFAPGIHIGEGIAISSVYSYQIGTNLRFLFQEKIDRDLPLQSYNEFAKRLHWKFYWWSRTGAQEDTKRNPQLISRFAESIVEPPQGNFYFEVGLNAGHAELLKQVSQAEPHYRPADSLNWESAKHFACSFTKINI